MNRVKDDDNLRHALHQHGPTPIHDPIIIVHGLEGNRQQYILHLENLDQMMQEPKLFGIVLSDLLDHIAAAYNRSNGRDERDIRDTIMRVMRDESRFKDKDPRRGNMLGATIRPKAN